MSLFQSDEKIAPAGEESPASPLSVRIRPRNFEEFVGQEHIIGPGHLLRQAIDSDQLSSIILWGPPGSGKTTIARIIACKTKACFMHLSAVTAGVADLRAIVSDARKRKASSEQKTILFVDEIHRFNKAQQDGLLPHVEEGTIILIGATTENPFFEVISPLVSRSRIFRLEPLNDAEIEMILDRCLADSERGLAGQNVDLVLEAKEFLIRASRGDARVALNALEWAAMNAIPNAEGIRLLQAANIEDALQRRMLRYDKDADAHFDTISAFIKSMRGSDPDATLYWLARMISAGEDPGFIARRIMICAAEDIGLADPMALVLASSTAYAVEHIGWPEAKIPLAQAAIYMACAAKSNSTVESIGLALAEVENGADPAVPLHLKNRSFSGATEMEYGKGYHYAHDFPGHFVQQEYLPKEFLFRQYYQPSDQGSEKQILERLRALWSPWKKYND
jgi:putative ATPase